MGNYFVQTNEDGEILAWFNDAMHSIIPNDVLPVTAEKHLEISSLYPTHYIDGEFTRQERVVTDAAEIRSIFKRERAELISAMTVEIDGMVFDADSTAKINLTAAVAALEPEETQLWVLADNTVAYPTREQLKRVLRALGAKHSEVWVQE